MDILDISTLGNFLRFKRTMSGMSQQEVTSKAVESLPNVRGFQRAALAHWEMDNRIPNHSQARAISDALSLSPLETNQLVELIIEAETKKP
tara:strand:- start:227 stop:499 length:273 start_codon:yes stop_codon:yes gene_type:complete